MNGLIEQWNSNGIIGNILLPICFSNTKYTVTGSGVRIERASFYHRDRRVDSFYAACTKEGTSQYISEEGYWIAKGY